MKAATGAVHTHACVPCGLPVARSASTAFGSGSPSHWLAACPRFNSLSPSRCPRSEGEECQGTLCFVLVHAACCEHGRRFSKRKNSNDAGNNGGGTYPRVCALLGLPVSLSAATAFGSGWSHYATTCPLATRDASSGPTGVYPARLVCLVACGDGVRQRLVSLRHCLPTCHQRRQQLFNRGGGCMRESSHRGQDRYQSEHSSICVSPGQQR